MAFDFSGLTERQKELLTFQGWSVGCKFPERQPSRQTVKKLIDRGLVVPSERNVGGTLSLAVTEYEVPIDVHAAWCFICACEGFELPIKRKAK